MYDELLGKKFFWERFKVAGLSDEVCEREWNKVVVLFKLEFWKKVMKKIPEKDGQVLLEDLNLESDDYADAIVMLKRISQYFTEHRGIVEKSDLKLLITNSIQAAYQTYLELPLK